MILSRRIIPRSTPAGLAVVGLPGGEQPAGLGPLRLARLVIGVQAPHARERAARGRHREISRTRVPRGHASGKAWARRSKASASTARRPPTGPTTKKRCLGAGAGWPGSSMKPVPTSIRLANYRLVPQQHGADVPQDDSRGFSGHGERLSRGMPTANELPGRQPEIARREAIALRCSYRA